MDILLGGLIAVKKIRKKKQNEAFKEKGEGGGEVELDTGLNFKTITASFLLLIIISIAIMILVGCLAVYLSWTSNTVCGWNSVFKTIYAIFAFIFGLNYIITYVICRLDAIILLKRRNTSLPKIPHPQNFIAPQSRRPNTPVPSTQRTLSYSTNIPIR
jgi:hypothetical protein